MVAGEQVESLTEALGVGFLINEHAPGDEDHDGPVDAGLSIESVNGRLNLEQGQGTELLGYLLGTLMHLPLKGQHGLWLLNS